MAKLVKDWFPNWAETHFMRLDIKCPAHGTDAWQARFWGWIKWFIDNEISETEATAASILMQQAESSPKKDPDAIRRPHWPEHLPELQKAIRQVRSASAHAQNPDGPPMDFAQAKLESESCPDTYCGGQGVTYRFKRDGAPVLLHCMCAAGRWLARWWDAEARNGRFRGRPAYDLAKYPHLQLIFDEQRGWWHPNAELPEPELHRIRAMSPRPVRSVRGHGAPVQAAQILADRLVAVPAGADDDFPPF